MTIFKDAFEKAGFDQLRFELKAVAPRFSREDWIAIYDEATERTPDEGQADAAQQGQYDHANVRQPMPEGHGKSVQQDHPDHADEHPLAGEASARLSQGHAINASTRDLIPSEGHQNFAQPGQGRPADAGNQIASGKGQASGAKQGLSLIAPPVREPSQADIEALKESGDFHYFQMINLRKKAWSTYRYKDLKNVRSLNMQENMIIQDVIQWGRDHRVKEDDLVSLTMPAKEMKEIVRLARSAIPSKADMTSPKRKVNRGR